jgi:hypothetical protein
LNNRVGIVVGLIGKATTDQIAKHVTYDAHASPVCHACMQQCHRLLVLGNCAGTCSHLTYITAYGNTNQHMVTQVNANSWNEPNEHYIMWPTYSRGKKPSKNFNEEEI